MLAVTKEIKETPSNRAYVTRGAFGDSTSPMWTLMLNNVIPDPFKQNATFFIIKEQIAHEPNQNRR